MIRYDVVKRWDFGEVRHDYGDRELVLYALAAGVGARKQRGVRFAMAWFATSFLTLSLTPSKQIHYAVLLVAPAALLIGWFVGFGFRAAADWRSIFRQLSATGLIAQDLNEHGRWWVTDEGRKVLRGEVRIELRKEQATAKASKRDRRAAQAAAVANDADAALLVELKALRAKLARQQQVPAYVVFSDRTLIELATHRPANPRAMREIHGIGDAKLERYGAPTPEALVAAVSGVVPTG